jgi:ankyrin repeat protein
MKIFRRSVLLFLGTCCLTQYLAAALGPLHALHYCKKPLAYSLELLKKISLSHPKEAALTTLCLTAGCVQWWMTHKDSLFMEAAKQNRPLQCSLIRLLGGRIHKPTVEQQTLFEQYIQTDKRNLLKELFRGGFSINAILSSGVTPLEDAIKKSDRDRASFYLQQGAKINALNKRGNTMLMEAALAGNDVMLLFLLNHGANLNTLNSLGQPVLFLPLPPERIELLVSRGARLDKLDAQGIPILTNAVLRNYEQPTIEKLIELVAQQHILDMPDQFGKNALMYAIERNQDTTVASLISHGASREIKDYSGHDAKEYTIIASSRYKTTESKEINKHIQGLVRADQLLYEAVTSSNIQNAQRLIEHYIPVNAIIINPQTEEKVTPLMIAASTNNIPMAKMLLAHGADTGALSSYGKSILHFTDDCAMTTLLLDHGASIDMQERHRLSTPLMKAVESEKFGLTALLLARHANPSLCDQNIRSPLHFATTYAIAQLLIQYGASCEAQDNLKFTPLMIAVQKNIPEIVQLYLENGARKDPLNIENLTALNIAQQIKKSLGWFKKTKRARNEAILKMLTTDIVSQMMPTPSAPPMPGTLVEQP